MLRGRLAYRLLIAPWPVFPFILCAIGIIGAFTPPLLVRVTSGLIDILHNRSPQPNAPLQTALCPLLLPLLQLTALRLINWLIYMDSFQRYLAARLNERVQEDFHELLFAKALALRLEWLEQASYYDALHRARSAMNSEAVVLQFTH